MVMAAWGQPLSLSFVPDYGVVQYSSETQTVMMPVANDDGGNGADDQGGATANGWRKGLATHR
jgi:hypothetical protein